MGNKEKCILKVNSKNISLSLKEDVDFALNLPYYTGRFVIYEDGAISREPISKNHYKTLNEIIAYLDTAIPANRKGIAEGGEVYASFRDGKMIYYTEKKVTKILEKNGGISDIMTAIIDLKRD